MTGIDLDDMIRERWGEPGIDATRMLRRILSELGERVAMSVMSEHDGVNTYTIDVDVNRDPAVTVTTGSGSVMEIKWNPKLGGK